MKNQTNWWPWLWLVISLLANLSLAQSASTAFVYQGKLNDLNGPATGSYDFQFALAATNNGGKFIAGPVTNSATSVNNGLFIATIDFGNVFTGTNYWLDISVRTNGAANFTELLPRQPIAPSPYALYAATAGNLANLSGNGSLLTNIPYAALTGTPPLPSTNGATFFSTNVFTAATITGPATLTTTTNASGITLHLSVNDQTNSALAELSQNNGQSLTGLNAASLTGTLNLTNLPGVTTNAATVGLPGAVYWQASCMDMNYSPAMDEANYLLVTTNHGTNFTFVSPYPVYVEPDLMTNASGPTARYNQVIQDGNVLYQFNARNFYVGNPEFGVARSFDQLHWERVANVNPFKDGLTNSILYSAFVVQNSDNSPYVDTNGWHYLCISYVTNFWVNGTQTWGPADIYLTHSIDATWTNWSPPVKVLSQAQGGNDGMGMFHINGLFYIINETLLTGDNGSPVNALVSDNLYSNYVTSGWATHNQGALLFLNTNLWWSLNLPYEIDYSTNQGTNWEYLFVTGQETPNAFIPNLGLSSSYGFYILNHPLTNLVQTVDATNTVYTGLVQASSISSGNIYANNLLAGTLSIDNGLSGSFGLPLLVSGSMYVGEPQYFLANKPSFAGNEHNFSAGENIINGGEATIALGSAISVGDASGYQGNSYDSFTFNDGSNGTLTNNNANSFLVYASGGILFTGSTVAVAGLASAGPVSASSFQGDGSHLTGIPYAALTGTPAIPDTNGAGLTNLTAANINGTFNPIAIGNQPAAPTPITAGGTFWPSNGALYWVTSKHTNYITGP